MLSYIHGTHVSTAAVGTSTAAAALLPAATETETHLVAPLLLHHLRRGMCVRERVMYVYVYVCVCIYMPMCVFMYMRE
jgi:hypothetical protein